ncbi:MAG: DUF4230 domain-containing protein [Aureispira sp.]|nr:DUF4230 domain-containing protein [Aureispira sp.]
MKLIDSFGFFLFGAVVGAFLYANYFGAKGKPHQTQSHEMLLERVKKVAKLITVEGEFANLHEYKDFYWSDISFLSKKAIIKVKAKVSVGYDLQKATFEADEVNKIFYVRDLPQPEVLSIDHDLEYYDMSEGMFNSFSEEDLTAIGKVAKSKLEKEVKKGPLMEKAKEEGIETLEIIRILVEQAGWTFEIHNAPETNDTLNIPSPNARVDSLLN